MENKTSKYFKYAIGEIVLVVIGILIALQVSNWNERRKVFNKTEALLDKFEDELELTILNANYDVSNSITGDSLIKRVLFNEVTKHDYQNTERYSHLLTWRFTLNPEIDNLKKVIEKEEILPEKYNGIMHYINRSNFTREREVDAMNLLRLSSEQNLDFISHNFSWARQIDSLSKDESYDYFLSNENYKNRLFSHWQKCMDYTAIIAWYRAESLHILSKLKLIRSNFKAEDFPEFFEKLEQKPFKEIDLNQNYQDLVSDDHTAKSSVILNFTKDTLIIKRKNAENILGRTRTLPPGDILTTRTTEIALDNTHLKIFEIYKDDICIKKYQEVQNGYLILE